MRLQRDLDYLLIAGTLILVLFGIIMIYSSTHNFAYNPDFGTYYLRQFMWAIFGLILMFVIANIDYQILIEVSHIFYILTLVLLIATFLFGGRIAGAQRWFRLGPISIQSSEIAKISIILMLVRFFTDQKGKIGIVSGLFFAFIIVMIPMALIIKQPDLGTALLFIPTVFCMLYIVGVRLKYLGYILGGFAFSFPFIWLLLKEYQKLRLLTFLNPGMDPRGAGYNVIQSQIAIGSGGFFGKGLMHGTQVQLNFVPEHHTDFIFAVIGEEVGFFGVLIILLLYLFIIFQGIKIVTLARDMTGVLIAIGITTLIAIQTIINIGMTMGILPVTGIPLPFMSYGGSSLLTNMCAIGILLSVHRCSTKFLG